MQILCIVDSQEKTTQDWWSDKTLVVVFYVAHETLNSYNYSDNVAIYADNQHIII